jgi:hypothetical protein
MSIPNRGPELLAVNIAFLITACAAWSLRCFVRIKMTKAFGFDDWLMGLATVSKQISKVSIIVINSV